jgi:hypothetical protein
MLSSLFWRAAFAVILAAGTFSATSLVSTAEAAPVKKVLSACDNTPGCGYSINKKNGDISGCSTTSGKCFYCPNDGKRQCFAVRRLPSAGKMPELLSGEVTLTK